jgi:cytidylate kinase
VSDATGAPRLVLISGPIASGKTSVAFELAARVRREGRRAAAIDMDDLVEMVGGDDWSLVTQDHRLRASGCAGKLARELFDGGFGLIAVAGSTLMAYESDELLVHLASPVTVLRVLLRVNVDEAILRAQADSTRVGTRDAEAVKALHSRIDWQKVPASDLAIETDGRSIEEVADLIEQRLVSP